MLYGAVAKIALQTVAGYLLQIVPRQHAMPCKGQEPPYNRSSRSLREPATPRRPRSAA